jgi:hypothetical protein
VSQFIVRDTSRGTERECETKSEAQETKQDMVSLGANPEDIEITEKASDGGVEADVIDHTKQEQSDPEATVTTSQSREPDIPENPPSVNEDPVDWMPDHFIDTIQGVPTVNRKGYAVIAAQYGVSVTAEPVTLASETDNEYAEFRAVATTEDGQEYSGFGSAHVERQDGDDPYLLNELAETRAMKRACAWATGIGMTAISELQNEL